jgi:hypothetical protein
MKKTLFIFLSLLLMLTFAACGEKNGGKHRQKAPRPPNRSMLPPTWRKRMKNRYYGIPAKQPRQTGFSITIDGRSLLIIQVCFQGRRRIRICEGLVYLHKCLRRPIDSRTRRISTSSTRKGPPGDDSGHDLGENSQVMSDVG